MRKIEYNIAAEILKSAAARKHLEPTSTGGGFDFITRELGAPGFGPVMVMGIPDDAGSPEKLDEPATVTLYLDGQDWSDGGYFVFHFDTAVEAMDFMAGFTSVSTVNATPKAAPTAWKPPMSKKDAAEYVISKLAPEDIAYARDPARGEFRGFAALHDKCDANMLIPGAEEYDASNDEQTAWMNRVMDRVTAIIIASGE